eukprot:g1991.t1
MAESSTAGLATKFDSDDPCDVFLLLLAGQHSLVGQRARVGGNLATIRWGPGELQAPKKPGEGYPDAVGT